jgi:hypothetical protein
MHSKNLFVPRSSVYLVYAPREIIAHNLRITYFTPRIHFQFPERTICALLWNPIKDRNLYVLRPLFKIQASDILSPFINRPESEADHSL